MFPKFQFELQFSDQTNRDDAMSKFKTEADKTITELDANMSIVFGCPRLSASVLNASVLSAIVSSCSSVLGLSSRVTISCFIYLLGIVINGTIFGSLVLAIGEHVPRKVREWSGAFWLASVPHAYAFPRCCCVVHHGGAGTTAAAAHAGVPSLVVPFLPWSDQPRFAAWVCRSEAGLSLSESARSVDDFSAALRRVLHDGRLRAGAAGSSP